MERGAREMLEKVQANRVLVLNVYRSVSREQVEQYLYKMLDPLLRIFVERLNIPVKEEDKQFIIDFYTASWGWRWNGSRRHENRPSHHGRAPEYHHAGRPEGLLQRFPHGWRSINRDRLIKNYATGS